MRHTIQLVLRLLPLFLFTPCCSLANTDIDKKIVELENSYLETKLQITEDYNNSLHRLSKLNDIQRKEALDEAYRVSGLIKKELDSKWAARISGIKTKVNGIYFAGGIISATLTLLGFIVGKELLKFRKIMKETNELFDILKKDLEDKEKELHDRTGTVLIDEVKDQISPIDDAKYLDYEHRLYFSYIYLPITKNLYKHKYSLYKLGEHWLEKDEPGRALLRFQEIENLQREIDNKKLFIVRIGKALLLRRYALIEERILGAITDTYFHKYGASYHGCAEVLEGELEREDCTENAERYYKKALALNPNRWNTYYNLGLLYSMKGEDAEAIVWYQAALRNTKKQLQKNRIYRNVACCRIRLPEYSPDDVVETLDNIPEGEPYWEEVVKDSELMDEDRIRNEPEYGIVPGFILENLELIR